MLGEAKRFKNEVIYTEIDIQRLIGERRRNTTFQAAEERRLMRIPFSIEKEAAELTRKFPKKPFVPADEQIRSRRCEEILEIQAMGLKKRLAHTGAKTAVVGLSGGLDSTLALLVTARAFEMLKKDKKEILAVTMPCFGTTDRTYQNAMQNGRTGGRCFERGTYCRGSAQCILETLDKKKAITVLRMKMRRRGREPKS